jgi:hypothetical protein
MSRPHPFVKYLQLQSLLARVADEMRELETSDVNYRLDREFSGKLDDLIQRYGYTDDEVVRILKLIHEHEAHGHKGILRLFDRKTPEDKLDLRSSDVGVERSSPKIPHNRRPSEVSQTDRVKDEVA